MACRLVGTKPLSEPVVAYFQRTHRNKTQLNFNLISSICIQENAFQTVICKMAAVLCQPQLSVIFIRLIHIKCVLCHTTFLCPRMISMHHI